MFAFHPPPPGSGTQIMSEQYLVILPSVSVNIYLCTISPQPLSGLLQNLLQMTLIFPPILKVMEFSCYLWKIMEFKTWECLGNGEIIDSTS